MLDLNACSNLQVAALRRMTSDPELAGRCDAWLQERGVRGWRHWPTLLFAELASAGLIFVWMNFEEMGDADAPSNRQLLRSGAVVTTLIVAYLGAYVFLLYLARSWRGRALILLVTALIIAVDECLERRKSRR